MMNLDYGQRVRIKRTRFPGKPKPGKRGEQMDAEVNMAVDNIYEDRFLGKYVGDTIHVSEEEVMIHLNRWWLSSPALRNLVRIADLLDVTVFISRRTWLGKYQLWIVVA